MYRYEHLFFYRTDKRIRILHEEDPAKINWKEAKVDYVIDATGKFTVMEKARVSITLIFVYSFLVVMSGVGWYSGLRIEFFIGP